MPVVGRANEHRVDVRAGEQLLVRRMNIGATAGSAAVFELAVADGDAVSHLFGLAAHDVTGRDDLAVLGPAEQRPDVGIADEAVAHEAEGEAIARCAFAKERGREEIGRRSIGDNAGQAAFDDGATGQKSTHGE